VDGCIPDQERRREGSKVSELDNCWSNWSAGYTVVCRARCLALCLGHELGW